jgi:hypothetical protein
MKPGLSIIRVLENKFGTTLGYDFRFNNSLSHVISDCHKQANDWIKFLAEKGLITVPADDVPSFAKIE